MALRRGACAPNRPDLMPEYSSGMLLRRVVVEGIKSLPRALTRLGERSKLTCICDSCGEGELHDASMEHLSDSVFCPVIPGDTQVGSRGCGMQACGAG